MMFVVTLFHELNKIYMNRRPVHESTTTLYGKAILLTNENYTTKE